MINVFASVALSATSVGPAEIVHTELAPFLAGVPDSSVESGWLTIRCTAYTHTESDHLEYGRKSALGTRLQFGEVRSAAADWSKFPVGTKFRIKGEPYLYVIDDYGSALVGKNVIDLYRPSKSSMWKWGARNVPIQIVEWGCYERSHKIMRARTHSKHVRRMVEAIEKRL